MNKQDEPLYGEDPARLALRLLREAEKLDPARRKCAIAEIMRAITVEEENV